MGERIGAQTHLKEEALAILHASNIPVDCIACERLLLQISHANLMNMANNLQKLHFVKKIGTLYSQKGDKSNANLYFSLARTILLYAWVADAR